jgi:hypothetical protein
MLNTASADNLQMWLYGFRMKVHVEESSATPIGDAWDYSIAAKHNRLVLARRLSVAEHALEHHLAQARKLRKKIERLTFLLEGRIDEDRWQEQHVGEIVLAGMAPPEPAEAEAPSHEHAEAA